MVWVVLSGCTEGKGSSRVGRMLGLIHGRWDQGFVYVGGGDI